ncbi:MAG: 3-phosphoshikimate 1-carboxyvinyltransferase, partial [Prolixibacteraceae bacterium]|nr:3-phosphoshikimate 1-carboxyvinyltransferase [Prolixibacteraceae bacterium]
MESAKNICEVAVSSNILNAQVGLPASKSISNRALIIKALSHSPYPIENLSESDDTQTLAKILTSTGSSFDVGHAGTTMRFLTAYLSGMAGEWNLNGSARMQQRPIGILVDALRNLGATIEYTRNEGFPPLRISGSKLKNATIELDGSVSSQYISALLMIAPHVKNGVTLLIKNKLTSRPYVEMTLKLMHTFGIFYLWEKNKITVPEQNYLPAPFSVEADWSSASYWYEILALCEQGE